MTWCAKGDEVGKLVGGDAIAVEFSKRDDVMNTIIVFALVDELAARLANVFIAF
jgi:predicted RNA methylase